MSVTESSRDGGCATVVDAGRLEQLLREPGVRIVDVRTPGEYETASIEGSTNLPLDELKGRSAEIGERLRGPVVLVCQSGSRARQAAESLGGAAASELHVLDGGLNGWIAAGKPVRRGKQRMSLERQVRIAAGALAATGGVLALTLTPWFALIPAFVGSGLVFAGVTDTCGMGMLLSRLPYNRGAVCDVDGAIQRLCAAGVTGRSDVAMETAVR